MKDIHPHELPHTVVTNQKECFWNAESKHLEEGVFIREEQVYIILFTWTISIIANLIDF